MMLFIGACLCGSGCVERLITVTSEPSGALVFLNDEEVGRTPASVPFTFYGTYDVRLEAEGYKPLWTKKKANAPWWEIPPIDLAAELIPDGKSHLDWHFQMDLKPASDEDALVERARQMRSLIGPKVKRHPDQAPPSITKNVPLRPDPARH